VHAFVFVHNCPLDFIFQVKLFRKFLAEPVHFTAGPLCVWWCG
jgi:hypothetical protein